MTWGIWEHNFQKGGKFVLNFSTPRRARKQISHFDIEEQAEMKQQVKHNFKKFDTF